MRTKRSKTWYMNINWLRKKYIIKQIILYLDKGNNNNSNYFKIISLQVFTASNKLVMSIIHTS